MNPLQPSAFLFAACPWSRARTLLMALLLLGAPAAWSQVPGDVVVVAGTGLPSFSGDGGPATSAALNGPSALGFDAQGNLYIADLGNHRIRQVDTQGTIRTVAGTTPVDPELGGFSGDGGPATEAQLSYPWSVAPLPAGGFVLTDNGNNRVRQVLADGTIKTIAGTGEDTYNGDDQPATSAAVNFPTDARPLGDRLLIADFGNNRVRVIGTDGKIATFAGNGFRAVSGDGGPATLASVGVPYGLAVDAQGNVYITDFGSHVIRKVDTENTITTIAGTADQEGFSGDGGPAQEAQLWEPAHIAAAPDGRIVFVDSGNNRVRQISPDGTIKTLAGTGESDPGDLSTNPLQLNLGEPTGVAISPSGEVYFTDNQHHRVLKIVGAPAPAVLPGDVNRNGRVDVVDALTVLRSIVGLVTLDAAQQQAADIAPKPGLNGRPYGDGKADVRDVIRILRRAASLDTEPTWPA